jgi:pimeloyl-ACP methyl ester carboxylesterase
MPAFEKIAIAPHLAFDVITAGTPGAPLVLLLHGFAESMHCWRTQVTALGDMGYRAIAPSQRGYSPGARPDPREFSHYLIDRLMDDAMAIAAAAGYGVRVFISPATTGAAASPGASPTVITSGWPRSPFSPGRTRTRSTARWRPIVSRRNAQSTTRRFWNRMPPMSCWPTTPNGCAIA